MIWFYTYKMSGLHQKTLRTIKHPHKVAGHKSTYRSRQLFYILRSSMWERTQDNNPIHHLLYPQIYIKIEKKPRNQPNQGGERPPQCKGWTLKKLKRHWRTSHALGSLPKVTHKFSQPSLESQTLLSFKSSSCQLLVSSCQLISFSSLLLNLHSHLLILLFTVHEHNIIYFNSYIY